MKNEVRNLKGEIVSSGDPDEKWYQLSVSTWLLIGGLTLFNIGCFVNPGIIDQLFRLLDIRLWPWWYFVFLGIIFLFSVKWFFMVRNREDFDEWDIEAAKRFHRMATVVIGVMFLAVFVNILNLYKYLYSPMERWLGYGEFSWMAIMIFSGILVVILVLVYFIKEWLTTLIHPT